MGRSPRQVGHQSHCIPPTLRTSVKGGDRGLLKKSESSEVVVLNILFSQFLTRSSEISVRSESPSLSSKSRYLASIILKRVSRPHVHLSSPRPVAPFRQVYALPSTGCAQAHRCIPHNPLSTTLSVCIAPSPACPVKRTLPPPSHVDSSSPVHTLRSRSASSPSITRADTSSEPRIVASVPAADIRFSQDISDSPSDERHTDSYCPSCGRRVCRGSSLRDTQGGLHGR